MSVVVNLCIGPDAVLSGGSSGVVLQGVVTLSAAQILASATVPVPVIPAPGAGQMIQVLNVMYELTFGTLAYTGTPSGQTVGALFYGDNTNNLQADGGDNGVFASAASTISTAGNGLPTAVIADLVNQPVVYECVGNGAAYTLGDGTGRIVVTYTVVPT